jgi:glycerol-3-phosphate dehydrogenase (NAD(P)+)
MIFTKEKEITECKRKVSVGSCVSVLGAGAWGTAISYLLAKNGHNVLLWSLEEDVALDIKNLKQNTRYLPGVELPSNVVTTNVTQSTIEHSKIVFVAVPVKFVRSVLEKIREFVTDEHVLVSLSKGVEQKTLLLPSKIIADVFNDKVSVAALSGPTFANELVRRVYSAAVIASDKTSVCERITQFLSNNFFKLYKTTDICGVQVGGAFKNVMAISLGIVCGLGYGENTISFLFTQGMQEINVLAGFFGGKQETIYGLSGLGDVFLTCRGSHSKNFKVGKLLGQGYQLHEILEQQKMVVPEGINTLYSVKDIAKAGNLALPFFLGIREYLTDGKCFKVLLDSFMNMKL